MFTLLLLITACGNGTNSPVVSTSAPAPPYVGKIGVPVHAVAPNGATANVTLNNIRQLSTAGGPFADNQEEPPDESARGQLLRMLASDAMRGAVERHFGARLAFQNCHRLALFSPDATAEYDEFVTPRAQVLNQKPELVNC